MDPASVLDAMTSYRSQVTICVKHLSRQLNRPNGSNAGADWHDPGYTPGVPRPVRGFRAVARGMRAAAGRPARVPGRVPGRLSQRRLRRAAGAPRSRRRAARRRRGRGDGHDRPGQRCAPWPRPSPVAPGPPGRPSSRARPAPPGRPVVSRGSRSCSASRPAGSWRSRSSATRPAWRRWSCRTARVDRLAVSALTPISPAGRDG